MSKHIERERSSAGLSVDEAHHDGITMGDTRDPNAQLAQERVRIPLNSGQKLSLRGYVLEESKFHYRWFHEDPTRPGNIPAAIGAFYEHCVDEQGHNITTPSGGGVDYLMRLPMKYHQDDVREAKEQRLALRKRTNAVDKSKGEYAPTAEGRAEGGDSMVISQRSSKSGTNPYA